MAAEQCVIYNPTAGYGRAQRHLDSLRRALGPGAEFLPTQDAGHAEELARAAAAVAHEHVVAVHAVVESAGLPFLVMEYVPGRSLQERIDDDGPMALAEILRIGHQTAAGLAAAHALGLVHRDIKPANILLENCVERVRLTDAGRAAVAELTTPSKETAM